MKTFEEIKLEEFEDKFCVENDFGRKEIAFIRMRDYKENEPIKTTYEILKEDIESFLKTALQQQKEEILKRLPEIREVLGFSEYAEGQVVGFNQILEEIRKIIKEI